MGIGAHELKALVELYKAHGPFGRVATLGRQELCVNVHRLPGLLKGIRQERGAAPASKAPKGPVFAESVFLALGATEVVSFDYSAYEGATVTHDMNTPLPRQFWNSFDLVYDGGTCEHVFNFPQAIKNCMDMVKVGGLFVGGTPSNNYMGHGFYQFSPELFFRLFSRENGFAIERFLAFECSKVGGAVFAVRDPMELGRRVELLATGARILLWVVARKVAAIAGHQLRCPQQSYYVTQWSSAGANPSVGAGKLAGLRPALVNYLHRSFPHVADCLRWLRDRWRCTYANWSGLRLDHSAFRPLR